MAKDLEMGYLLDFYGEVLTEKQREMLRQYYNDDLSLSEIGENFGITRQGARDAIKHGETTLKELEEKVGFAARYRRVQQKLEELEQLANGEEVFEKMVVTMKKLSEDEKIRMQCEAREDYERCLLSEFNAGKREGEEIGEQRGRAMGEEIGEKRGKDETEKKLVQHLMQSMKLSETDAKKMLGL